MNFHATTPHQVKLLDGRNVVIEVRKRISPRELRAIIQNGIDTAAVITAFTSRRPDWIDEVNRDSLGSLSNLCLLRAVEVMKKNPSDPTLSAALENLYAAKRFKTELDARLNQQPATQPR
jgi:hypothetical protein